MLPALALPMDATTFGVTASAEALIRASVRVRAYTGQQISSGSSTVTLRGSVARLPQRPVRAVTSVVDADGQTIPAADWKLLPGGLLEVPTTGLVTVTYDHGFVEVPDEVIELVVTVAARLSATDPGLAGGVTQEQSGSSSQTFGVDAWRGLSSLTAEEKRALDRLFPRLPRSVVMRP